MDKESLLAPEWIFKYFQIFGIHLVEDGHKRLWIVYQIIVLVTLITSCVVGFEYKTFLSVFSSITGIVSIIECKFYVNNLGC